MSQSSFNCVIVRDARINDVSSKIDYIVPKGAAQNNYQHVNDTSKSSSNINFSVNVPSENTLIDRNVTITTEIQMNCTVTNIAASKLCIAYGATESLGQFPFNSLCNTSRVTINEANTSVNTNDMMATLIKMHEDTEFNKYNCPYMSDKLFKKYEDMALSVSNPLSSINYSEYGVVPRGVHPIKFTITKTSTDDIGEGPVTTTTTVTHSDSYDAVESCLTSAGTDDSWTIEMKSTTTEPLLFLSPFTYTKNNNNNAALYGVRNMDFVFTLDSSGKKLFSSSSGSQFNNITIDIKKAVLNLNYLSVQPSDLLSSKNVVPYVDYSRYLTQHGSTVIAGNSFNINSNSIQFNQVPNRIYIIARKKLSDQNWKDTNSFLAINSISLDFNNVSGILSNCTPEDLYNMSVANGSKQSLYEFLGECNILYGKSTETLGSILVIDPSKNMNLPDYLSNGSVGQFNLQAKMSFKNTDVNTITPELLIIAEYNGLFITQSGQSTQQTSLLTSELVVNSTMSQFGESDQYVKSFNNSTNLSSFKNVPYLNMKKSGVSKSGGAYSGGSQSQLRNVI